MTRLAVMSTIESAALGLLAIAFFLSHWVWHLFAGDPWNALWACHVASLVIGIGALTRRSKLVLVGLLWLSVGIPLWGIFLCGGGALVPTSLLTHFGAATVGLLLLRKSPFCPARQRRLVEMVWWQACVALAALVMLSRWMTSRADNINLAFDIHGRRDTLPNDHALYLIGLAAVVSLVFYAAEKILRQVFKKRDAVLFD
ncbi:MAG: hypothetical protein F9B45_02275 [Phycisphaera sp. RhM]|nr:hypothetical protein [Phycisphaera sp. RhM]